MSRVQTEEASPYSESFAQRIASSVSLKGVTDTTGPEYLMLHDLIVLARARDHGGLIEEAAAGACLAAGGDG